MRQNLPITQTERRLEPGATLVSTTDLKGRTTYCNPAFIAISGFTEDELIGKPHNVVRHPDMPPAAFADMWETIQAGEPWTALVKNRCKNGDFYWVRANAVPMLERGAVVGYMSVRTCPEPAEIAAAETLYAAIREGRSRWALSRGRLVRTGLPGRVQRLAALSLGARFALATGAPTLVALGGALLGSTASVGALAPVGLAALASAIGAAWLQASVSRPLADASRAARSIAGGQMGASLRSERADQVGALMRDVNQVGVNILALVADVRSQVGSMEQATAEIAQGNLDLSARTEQSAAALQETAASMEQIAGTVRNTSEAAQNANRLAADALGVARDGDSAIRSVGGLMDEITASSRRIGDITSLIDSIAFQTNILALNAAVEAARAGEQGRGFAVVATEVRALAQRSAEAAREIKQLTTEASIKVDQGAAGVRQATETIGGISTAVQNVGGLIDEIAAGTTEQSRGVDQINIAVADLDRSTTQNAALVEQAAGTAGQLKTQAQRLSQAIGVFRV
jgi:aerotaxis receptor